MKSKTILMPPSTDTSGILLSVRKKYALSISDGDFFTFTRHEPVGVCGQIIPVSYALDLVARNPDFVAHVKSKNTFVISSLQGIICCLCRCLMS